MIDNLTRQLLTKYLPNDPRLQQEPLQAVTAITKSEAPPVQHLAAKSALGVLQEVAGMVIIMSSNDYTEGVIFKALREFNTQHPELMSRSFTLPVAQSGIPVGSWVFITQEED
ncbi:hypothetical protein [Pseudomonas sp. K2I15]|uniref:hypothetical protein n=1 Tax=Pseudomonas sp. K2I15 TaxID=2013577 RepID=UPI000B4D9077|nr:hypothetical protein [Pseudomonas sp. K2I15]OWP73511.1 hypothetical protein CEC48_00030 [Pseudomonas sp. K2I15]